MQIHECDICHREHLFQRDSEVENGKRYLSWVCVFCKSYGTPAERYRLISKLRKYGINLEIYDEAVAAQDGRCAICNRKGRLVIDHNHVTNQFRGLLCNSCNTGLGMFRDSAETLTSAAAYLKKVDDDERVPPLPSNPDDNPSSCVRG